MQERTQEHIAALAQLRSASERAEAACCRAEAGFGLIPAAAEVTEPPGDCAADRSAVVKSQPLNQHDVVAAGSLAIVHVPLGSEHSAGSIEGPWYRLPAVTASASQVVCSERERLQRHSEGLAASVHVDVAAAQVFALSQHTAFAACLPALRQRLEPLLSQQATAQCGAVPISMSQPVAPQRAASSNGMSPHVAAQCAAPHATPAQPLQLLPGPPPRHANGAVSSEPGVNVAQAFQQRCETMWATVAPPDSTPQLARVLGPAPNVEAWGNTSVLFLGTGSAEPSKYRGSTGILLQVLAVSFVCGLCRHDALCLIHHI